MHIACMPKSITIRDVPDETRDELAARAARSGRSLQEYLRLELIALSERPDPVRWAERARSRASELDRELTVDEILEMRDSGRR